MFIIVPRAGPCCFVQCSIYIKLVLFLETMLAIPRPDMTHLTIIFCKAYSELFQ